MTEKFAVIGHPVAHSQSPALHQAFAAQHSIELDYSLIDCAPAQFDSTVMQFFATGGRGLNVTLPHKAAAFLLAHQVGMRARLANAANTLYYSGEVLLGDNTDGTGLVRDLVGNLQLDLRDSHIVIIGAGGAARGIAAPLLGLWPARLTIANRTVERAVALAENLSGLGNVHARALDHLQDERCDVVINATAASLSGQIPVLNLDVSGAIAYDIVYSSRPTLFMEWADQHGAAASYDGWGMLVEQAAESFYLWHQVWPDTRPMIDDRKAYAR
ncbi:MAG: shikimate dehydrogenase [Gammaproteobacteria bacterium]|nr:shikimate dehydrogenase [Gammaproteobacteria bacterium]